MRLDHKRVQVPYRAGRFSIAGSTTTTNDTYLVRISDGDAAGLGEATPSVRVTGVGPDAVAAGLTHADAALEDLRMEESAAPPSLPLAELPPPVACGVDGALLDMWARALDRPLWAALSLPRPRILTTATVSMAEPREMADEARRLLEAGFRTLKVKLGDRDATRDRARIHAVAAAAPDLPLRVDANEGWDHATTQAILPHLAERGVEVVEQPLPRDASAEELRAVTVQAGDLGVAHLLDEAAHGPSDVERIGRERLAHGVVLKLQKTGGLRAGLDVIDTADDHGLRVMVGCFLETWAGIALALQLAGRVAWADLDGAWLLAAEPVVPDAPLLVNGMVTALDRPGLGVMPAADLFPLRSTLRP